MKAITHKMFREGHNKPEFEKPSRLELLSDLPNSYIENRVDLASLFHSKEYIKSFRDACRKSRKEYVEFGGTPVSPETYDLAGYAIGAGIKAAQLALDNKSGEGGLALVRPPGHHATKNMPPKEQGLGFCFLNTSAIAALWLAQKGLKVFVYDCDLHQGNGTQDAVRGNENIRFLSTQQRGVWPHGCVHTNTEWSIGNCFNLVFPSGCSDDVYLNGDKINDCTFGVNEVIPAILSGFEPDIALLSLGADGYHKDFGMLGDAYEPALSGEKVTEGFKLTTRTYKRIRNYLSHIKRRFAILEGGYNSKSVAEVANVFLDDNYK